MAVVSDRPFLVTGERAALGLLRREHLPEITTWFNDPDVKRGLAHRGVVSEEGSAAWYDKVVEAGRQHRPTEVAFAIHAADDGAFVGVCGLEDIDHNFSRCEFGIWVARRGEGIGTDATRLALDWAFTVIGLHNVMLETYEFNEAGIRAYERAGFKPVGRRRDAVRALGRRWDTLLMDATATEFESPVLLEKLRP
jgi:RimJ/RimL family protein N-acetyltransferase